MRAPEPRTTIPGVLLTAWSVGACLLTTLGAASLFSQAIDMGEWLLAAALAGLAGGLVLAAVRQPWGR